MQGSWKRPDRVPFKVGERSLCFDCRFIIIGPDFYQRYCTCPGVIAKFKDDRDMVLDGCDGCEFVEVLEESAPDTIALHPFVRDELRSIASHEGDAIRCVIMEDV